MVAPVTEVASAAELSGMDERSAAPSHHPGRRRSLGRRARALRLAAVLAASTVALAGCVAAGDGGPGARNVDGAPLLIVGDSNTAAANSWANHVSCSRATWAKAGLGLVNRTSQAGPALRNRVPEVMAGHRGYRVVVMLGTNDMLGPPPSVAGYRRIADQFRANGAASVVFAVPPPVGPGHWATSSMTAGWSRWKAAVRATPGSVDFVYPLGGRLDPSEQYGDGIHLNSSSQRAIGAAANRQLC
ncbi:MAG: SGNH/GDSL hydrolase family protein [Microthrixaceae bacterium]